MIRCCVLVTLVGNTCCRRRTAKKDHDDYEQKNRSKERIEREAQAETNPYSNANGGKKKKKKNANGNHIVHCADQDAAVLAKLSDPAEDIVALYHGNANQQQEEGTCTRQTSDVSMMRVE